MGRSILGPVRVARCERSEATRSSAGEGDVGVGSCPNVHADRRAPLLRASALGVWLERSLSLQERPNAKHDHIQNGGRPYKYERPERAHEPARRLGRWNYVKDTRETLVGFCI